MLPDLMAALALAFPIPAVELGCPDYYYDPCEALEFWSSLTPYNAQQIPSDGVLLLQGAYQGSWDDSASAMVELTVTLAGEPVAGALELSPLPGLLVWRPTEGWVPGATYELTGTLANPSDPDGLNCAPEALPIASEVVIASEPAGPLGKPGLSGTPTVTVQPLISIETLACCDGATPKSYPVEDGCGGVSSVVEFDSNQCAPISGIGWLTVDFVGTPPAEGPAAKQIVYTWHNIGNPPHRSLNPLLSVVNQVPICAALEALDLASGATSMSASLCFDGDGATLGPQSIPVPDTLTCSLQQCGVDDNWDPNVCEPLEPDSGTAGEGDGQGDGDKGCGCDSTNGPGDMVALGLVGLLALARRRRSGG